MVVTTMIGGQLVMDAERDTPIGRPTPERTTDFPAVNAEVEHDVAGYRHLAGERAESLRREQAARAELERVNRLKDELLAAITHDLSNPLTIIKTTAELLQRRTGRMGTPAARDFERGLTDINAATTRMTAMIRELLDLAHLEAGRPLSLERSTVDLVALVQQCAAQHQQFTDRHTITVKAAERQLVGMWDAGRLERVISNLLTNATKYSLNGGPITVAVARRRAASNVWATLRVEDQGIGIPAADLPHIFERFRRGSNVVGRTAGSGIGLSGARQIVTQHGGTLLVDSREGAGTAVTVHLPLHGEP